MPGHTPGQIERFFSFNCPGNARAHSNDFFRFIADGTKLVEFESGNAMNESKSIAIQAAMETAVVELIKQGREKGYWLYAGE